MGQIKGMEPKINWNQWESVPSGCSKKYNRFKITKGLRQERRQYGTLPKHKISLGDHTSRLRQGELRGRDPTWKSLSMKNNSYQCHQPLGSAWKTHQSKLQHDTSKWIGLCEYGSEKSMHYICTILSRKNWLFFVD